MGFLAFIKSSLTSEPLFLFKITIKQWNYWNNLGTVKKKLSKKISQWLFSVDAFFIMKKCKYKPKKEALKRKAYGKYFYKR